VTVRRRRGLSLRVLRCLAVAPLAIPLAPLPSALGDGVAIPHDLAGVRLCVDDESIRVSFPRDETRRLAELVGERLERAVAATFDAAALPWRREPTCPETRGYLEIALEVHDAPYLAPGLVMYDAVVRVGPRAVLPEGVRAAPPDAFDFAVTELYDEAAVRVPAFVFLPAYVEAALRDLGLAWWEDHVEAQRRVPAWVPPVGIALAALAAALAVPLARAMGRRRSPRPATAPSAERPYHRV
jgi:hypothetical protein